MATNSSGKLSNSSFTVDFHRCGKCSVEYDSLEDFICHKITVDKCSLVLWESKKLIGIGLKIPSFMETDDCQKKSSDSLLPDCPSSRISFGHDKSDKINAKKRRGRPRKYEKAMDKNLSSCLMLNSKSWECYPCKLTFPSCTTLDGHNAEKHKLSESPEVICTDRVETKVGGIGHSPDIRHDSLIIPENISMGHVLGPESSKESTCHKCGNNYKDSVVLKTHLKTVHCDMRPYKCKFDCPLSFKTKGSLMRHIRRHTGERPYKCKQCGRSFRESGALTRHLKSRFPCSTKTDNDLARYGKTVNINEYECDKVGEESLLPGSIIKVIITDISDKPKENLHEQAESSHIDCGLIIDKYGQDEICVSNETNSEQVLQKTGESSTISLKAIDGKVSVNSFESTENELTMNTSSPKTREISAGGRECMPEVIEGSPSNSLKDLVVENENLKCVACMQNFSSKIDLKSHLMLHVGSLPFRCIQCCYVCQSKQELVKHQRRRHGILEDNASLQKSDHEVIKEPVGVSIELEEENNIQNTVKQLFRTQNSIEADELEFSGLIKKPAKHSSRCHICLKRFSGSLYLGCHMGIHTGEKPYSCSICQKSFFLKDSLKKHKVCHSEERKFRCGECYKSFKRLSHVRDHLRIHSLLCPYQCAKCGKAFRWQGTLKSHELSHGGPALRVHLCIVCGRRFPSKWSLVRHQRLHSSDVTSTAHSHVHKSGVPDDHSHGKGKDLNGLSPDKVVSLSGDSYMSQKQHDINIEEQVSSISDGGTETYVLITQEDGSSCLVPTVAIVEEFQEETSTVNNIEDGYT